MTMEADLGILIKEVSLCLDGIKYVAPSLWHIQRAMHQRDAEMERMEREVFEPIHGIGIASHFTPSPGHDASGHGMKIIE